MFSLFHVGKNTTAETICRGGRKCIFKGKPCNRPCFWQLKKAVRRAGTRAAPINEFSEAGGGCSPTPTNRFLGAGDPPPAPRNSFPDRPKFLNSQFLFMGFEFAILMYTSIIHHVHTIIRLLMITS